MNQPTHGVIFTIVVLFLIGYIAGGYCGFVVGVMWDDWMKRTVQKVVTEVVDRWHRGRAS